MPNTVIVAPETAPPRHGLIDSVTPLATVDDRWEGGFTFVPENCTEPETWVAPCKGTITQGDTITTTTKARVDGAIDVTPFVLRAEFECDTASRAAIDFEQRARRILESGQSKAIESELSNAAATGTLVNDANTFLTNSLTFTDTPIGAGVATTPRLGLIQLVQTAARAASGARATIHATPATVLGWWQANSLVEAQGRLFTAVGGHQVVAGSGYTGHGPDNTPNVNDDEHWAYITSPIQLLLGEIEAAAVDEAETIDRATNDMQIIVQRTAAVFWDQCLHRGVNIDTMGII